MRQQTRADPSNAQEMDPASFMASLTPELREEILLSAGDDVLLALPANLVAEAQVMIRCKKKVLDGFHQLRIVRVIMVIIKKQEAAYYF